LEPRPPRWELYPSLSSEEISRIQSTLAHLRLSPLVVQLLANRGLREPAEIERFLRPPEIDKLPDPLLMVGMSRAVDRICDALTRGEKIVVYGDFDADGVTATALLTIALNFLGAKAEPYVPNRITEGYGVNVGALNAIAGRGAKLVITVDCGISNREEIAEARKRLGLDLIVTDHHQLPSELPDAICINPNQHADDCEDFKYLAGVGVAYQLVRALIKCIREREPARLKGKDLLRLRDNLLGLVAIGTVADIAPLKGANRSLVKHGLAALPRHSLPGLRTMLEFAHVNLEGMDTERIGFVIGPRLNAAGRLEDARTAYQLLMTEDPREARDLAQKLEAQNRRRQALMNSVTDQAREHARKMPDDVELILLHSPIWQSDVGNPLGVVGLVAGKLAEEFGRPTLVLAPGLADGESRGSARSTSDFDIHQALDDVKDLLVRFGGHKAAAGLTIRNEHIEELNRRLCELAHSRMNGGGSQPIHVDSELPLSMVTDDTLEAISALSPFGAENPTPLFMARNVHTLDAYHIGETAHLKLILADRSNISSAGVEAIAFRSGYMLDSIKRDRRVDILFHIERREWKGNSHLQLRLRDLRLSS
jgi:single-stranded-DNA-specific exonuclease